VPALEAPDEAFQAHAPRTFHLGAPDGLREVRPSQLADGA
jgi:hypothetical protein